MKMKDILFELILSKKIENRYNWRIIKSKHNNNIDNIDDFFGHIKEDYHFNAMNKSSLLSLSSSNFNNKDYINSLFYIKNIWSIISDLTFLVRKKNHNNYYIFMYFDIENQLFNILHIHKNKEIKLKIFFYNYLSSIDFMNMNSSLNYPISDTNNIWINHITSCVDCYLHSDLNLNDLYKVQVLIDLYIYDLFFEESKNNDNIKIEDFNDTDDINIEDNINNKYKKLWVQCESCYGLNYKKFFKSKMNICEHCGFHLKMSSSDRIELLIDHGTWEPMDENLLSVNPIDFYSEEESYADRLSFYQKKTGLIEAVQTGVGKLKKIPVAMGVMDFQFMGGSMGSVVGEKITRLIEYAAKKSLPVIIICASGGARMQEGSLSLMQMAKISSVLYDYQLNKNLFYISILTSPTTGGVTASFGMLGDIIIVEPNAYIAFAGKRVIEQTLKKIVPEGLQTAENLFHKGLFDLIVPRNLLKGVLYELFKLQGLFPLNIDSNSK
uniref:Acetyl-coenzyme A carboxylase carboxyl transferase subunit beta, chloroplastic n=1 Tax=Gastrodia javanica TaxID=2974003 RepID=A0A976UFA8_9ASPA|nr:acetyl-CoA carboxylase carboxyltransferase beta subunit [Gastrodia javanica]UVG40890.1 acetyl-CoA carboxylase carboxyltransferase beta subunit [Gastrodia javanica]